MENSILR